MRIHYSTSNRTKFLEAALVFQQEQVSGRYELCHTPISLQEIQGSLDEIATSKALSAFSIVKEPVIIDDFSVHCNALNGLPGPYIRAFLEKFSDIDLYKLLEKLGDLRGSLTSSIGYFDGKIPAPKIFSATAPFTIVLPRGEKLIHGMGWNRIALLEGQNKTIAEMDLKEFSLISPRSRALGDLKNYLLQGAS